MTAFLGVDIGTYESKGILVDASGRVLATAARPHRMLVPQPGWAEHRPVEDWWDDLAAITRQLLAESGLPPGTIGCVAVSAIGPCMLPVDAQGEPLGNAVLYGVDTRAAAEVAELSDQIGEAALLRTGGNTLTSQAVGPKILWLRRNRPEIYARTALVLSSTPFLVQRLTGAVVMDHYSAGSFSPLYDVSGRCWNKALAGSIISTDALPRLVETTEIVGTVTRAAAEATGLAAGTPVIAGTIDAAAEAFSVGVHAPGDLMLMYGSTVFTIMLTAAPLIDSRVWYAPWIVGGLHASAASLTTCGTLTHWFRDQLARDLSAPDAMARLTAEAAATPPGANGLVALPYFSGERNNPRAKGCFFGLDLTHERGHLFRAVLEGIACGVRQLLETYAQAGCTPRRAVAVGGGTRNAVWLQAVADSCGIEQALPTHTLGAAFGDAMLAAVAVGAASLEDVRGWNPIAGTSQPNPGLRALYDRQFGLHQQLYGQTEGLMAALAP